MFRFFVLCLSVSLIGASPYPKLASFLKDIGSRIVNGDQAVAGQFPWQVAIYVTNAQLTWFCGGSIISNEWILTAGHCVDRAQQVTIITGTISSSVGDYHIADRAVLHPDYLHDAVHLENDIGLLHLAEPLTFDDSTSPIALSSEEVPADTHVTVSGWGLTHDTDNTISPNLNYVNLVTISNDDCSQYYPGLINDGVVCATYDSPEVESTCEGDSGGPLVINADSNPQQVGVVSFVSSLGCESGAPSGYTRVAEFRDWIQETTGV